MENVAARIKAYSGLDKQGDTTTSAHGYSKIRRQFTGEWRRPDYRSIKHMLP